MVDEKTLQQLEEFSSLLGAFGKARNSFRKQLDIAAAIELVLALDKVDFDKFAKKIDDNISELRKLKHTIKKSPRKKQGKHP